MSKDKEIKNKKLIKVVNRMQRMLPWGHGLLALMWAGWFVSYFVTGELPSELFIVWMFGLFMFWSIIEVLRSISELKKNKK